MDMGWILAAWMWAPTAEVTAPQPATYHRARPACAAAPFSAAPWITVSRTLDGLMVRAISAGSPAALAGLQAGDVIVAVDGEPTAAWGSAALTRFSHRNLPCGAILRTADDRTVLVVR